MINGPPEGKLKITGYINIEGLRAEGSARQSINLDYPEVTAAFFAGVLHDIMAPWLNGPIPIRDPRVPGTVYTPVCFGNFCVEGVCDNPKSCLSLSACKLESGPAGQAPPGDPAGPAHPPGPAAEFDQDKFLQDLDPPLTDDEKRAGGMMGLFPVSEKAGKKARAPRKNPDPDKMTPLKPGTRITYKNDNSNPLNWHIGTVVKHQGSIVLVNFKEKGNMWVGRHYCRVDEPARGNDAPGG